MLILSLHIHADHVQPIPPHVEKGEKEPYTLLGEIVSTFNTFPKKLRINHKDLNCVWLVYR